MPELQWGGEHIYLKNMIEFSVRRLQILEKALKRRRMRILLLIAIWAVGILVTSFYIIQFGREEIEHDGLHPKFTDQQSIGSFNIDRGDARINYDDPRLKNLLYRWKRPDKAYDEWKPYKGEIVFDHETPGTYTLEVVEKHLKDSEDDRQDVVKVNTLSREYRGTPKDKDRPEKLLHETAQLAEIFEEKFEFFFLGSGTFGSVYLAAPRAGLGLERFAVKIATDYKGRSALKKERKVMSKLLKQDVAFNESHTVTYLSTKQLGGRSEFKDYLFLPYADMGTLKGYADAKISIDPHTALDLTLQLVKGALELQVAGYVHHDIKLANALMYRTNKGPLLKLVDFGSASETGKSCKMGTPHYTAPEVYRKEKIRLEPKNVTKARSEIRKLGFSRSKTHTRYAIRDSTIDIYIRSHTETYKELKDGLNGHLKEFPYLKSASWKCVRKCDPVPTNEKLDVYSIGTVFFALLTGERFRPRNPKKTHSYIELSVEDRVEMLDGESKNVAKEFFPLLDYMLAIDPKTRCNLRECEDRLLNLLEETPETEPEGLQITMTPPGGIFAPGTDPVIIHLWYPPES